MAGEKLVLILKDCVIYQIAFQSDNFVKKYRAIIAVNDYAIATTNRDLFSNSQVAP